MDFERSLTSVDETLSKYPPEDLVLLFRGTRNENALVQGNWWTEDAFYALGLTETNNSLFLTAIPKALFLEMQRNNQLTNESDHQGNKYFFKQFSLPVRRLKKQELESIMAHTKVAKLGGAQVVKTKLSPSERIQTSRKAVLSQ